MSLRARGLSHADLHEMLHVLVTLSGIVNGPLKHLGYKPLGLLNLPLMNTPLIALTGNREGPLARVFSSDTLIGSVLRGEGPILGTLRENR